MYEKNITGIVLAGGKSSRFGSDKAMASWKGKTLLENAIRILEPCCDKVVISSNNPEYMFTGCEVWPDTLKINAAITGFYSCLKKSETELNLILSCDMPLISTNLLEYLIANIDNYEAIVPVHDTNHVEPLCGLYRKSFLPAIEKNILEKNYSLQKLLSCDQVKKTPISLDQSFYHPDLFVNVNSVSDLEAIE